MGDGLKKYLQSLKTGAVEEEPEELKDEKPLSFGEIMSKSLTNPLDMRIFGLNPYTIGESVYEGVKSATETQKESEKAILKGDIIGGQLGKMAAVMEGGFGLGTAVSPQLMAFTQGMQDISKVVPPEIMKYSSPITALTEPKTLGGRSAAKIGDVLLQLGFIKGAGKFLPKGTEVVKTKPTVIKEAKPETIQEIKPDITEVPKVDFTEKQVPQALRDNKKAIDNLLNDDPSLSGSPKLISKRLTSMVEKGELPEKVSIETIKSITDEWVKNRPKPEIQEIKATPNELGLKISNELNNKTAVAFDKGTGFTIKETLEKYPEFKPYVKDLTDINEVTTQLNSLYWKKRHGEKLPEIQKEPVLPFKEEPKIEQPIEGFRTTFSKPMEYTQKSKGEYIALDEPYTGQGEITKTGVEGADYNISKVKREINREKIFDPENKLEGTKTTKEESQKFSEEFFKQVSEKNPKGGSPEMAEIRTDILKKMGYEGEIGSIYPEEANSPRELILFKPPETTSIKNALMNEKRVERGLEPLQTKDVRPFDQVTEEAMQRIKSGQVNPKALAQEIIDKPRLLTDTETTILNIEARRLENQKIKILDEISKETNPEIKNQKLLESLKIDEEYNVNNIAGKQTGTNVARALNIRKLELREDYSPAPLLQRARVANNNNVLPEDIKVKLEDYSQKIVQGEQKVKDLEARLKNVEAENFLRDLANQKFKQRTERRTVAKENLDVEYDALVKEWATTQQLNALVDPKQVQLIIKMATNRFQKGGLTVEQVIDQIYQVAKNYVKDLTIDEVRDALRGGGRFKKMTEGEIKSEIRGIRKQTSMESLQKSYKTRLQNRKAELEEMLKTGNYERQPRRKTEMNPELRELKDQVDLLKLHADREIQALENKNKPLGTKIFERTLDFVSLFKSTVSGGEFSQVLRQGMLYAANPFHIKQVYGKGGAFREQFKYLKSESAYRDLQRQIKEDPNALIHKKMGVEFSSLQDNKLRTREEFFQSRLTRHIPWIRPFERSFTGFLDKLRLDVSNDIIKEYQKAGQNIENNPKLYEATGSWINNATGRGNFRTPELHRLFDQGAPVLGLGLFSPRLIVSRMQLLNPYYYARLPKQARVMAMKDMLGFIGTGATALMIAKIAGADVETNLTSSDALKVKVGDTRIDPWGGMQQFVVLSARILKNETKTNSGKIRSLSGKEFPFKNRWDVARETLLENKLNPTFQAVKGFLTQKEWASNEPYGLDDAAINLLVPLYYQDLIDAVKQQGIEGLMLTAPGFFGVGVQTYKKETKTKSKGFK